MKLPLNWLKEYVNIDGYTPQQLADKLVNVGFEVEEIVTQGENIVNVKTGKVVSADKHPNADKLRICNVDMGEYETVIATAATNVMPGDVVPVALDDSYLPTGKHIVASPLRGVLSNGMFCSGKELMIDNSVIDGAEVDGILILPPSTPLGADIRDVLGLNDTILDISVTSNRPDCQSVFGIAREIATTLGQKAIEPNYRYVQHEIPLTVPSVSIENTENCPRYTGRLITDVKIEPSPKWMRSRLRAVGVRPINNVVDVTNYVLMEIGQPLHAFDVNLVLGGVYVRSAKNGEEIVALDGKNYKLDESMLVIADKDKPVAIAGVMGGEYSGINDDTQTVFLESARFAKGSVRATSRKLGLRSDSSARFEKGVDFDSVEKGRERALALFYELNVGKVCSVQAEAGVAVPDEKIIQTSAKRINGLLGIEVPLQTILDILNHLGIQTTASGDVLICRIPLYREDIDNYTDLAEEVIRYYGYDNLRSTFIENARPTVGGVGTIQKNIEKIKDIMVGYGAFEALTYSFISPKQYDLLEISENSEQRKTIPILNPLGADLSIMRTQLVGSMLSTVALNLSRKNKDFRLFEIAKIYVPRQLPLTELPEEKNTLSFAFVGENEDFYQIKGVVSEILTALGVSYRIERATESWLHPGISVALFDENNDKIGSFGKLHPTVAKNYDVEANVLIGELVLESYLKREAARTQFVALPKYQAVERDLAIIVDESVAVGDLIDTIKESAGALCRQAELFDLYRGEQIEAGKKSVALKITLLSDEKTLVDAEIQQVMDDVLSSLNLKYNAIIRS